jgi:hypothetical protein
MHIHHEMANVEALTRIVEPLVAAPIAIVPQPLVALLDISRDVKRRVPMETAVALGDNDTSAGYLAFPQDLTQDKDGHLPAESLQNVVAFVISTLRAVAAAFRAQRAQQQQQKDQPGEPQEQKGEEGGALPSSAIGASCQQTIVQTIQLADYLAEMMAMDAPHGQEVAASVRVASETDSAFYADLCELPALMDGFAKDAFPMKPLAATLHRKAQASQPAAESAAESRNRNEAGKKKNTGRRGGR